MIRLLFKTRVFLKNTSRRILAIRMIMISELKSFELQLNNSFMEGNNTAQILELVHNELISLCTYEHAVVH